MFAKYLFSDDSNRPSPLEAPEWGVRHDPSTADIENAVRTLNGTTVRMVVIGERAPHPGSGYPFGGHGMLVGGGGPNGLFVAKVVTEGDDTVQYLSKPDQENPEWCDVTFGQPSEYEGTLCVDFETVLEAVKVFAETGGLVRNGVTWVSREE